MNPNLICHLDFESTVDQSGNGNDLTHNGTLSGGALNLNGVNQYGDIKNLTSLPSSCTVIISFLYLDVTKRGYLLGLNQSSGSNGCVVGLGDNLQLKAISSDATGEFLIDSSVDFLKSKTTMALVLNNGTSIKTIVNGKKKEGDFITNVSSLKPFTIGAEYDGSSLGDYVNGEVFELKIYSVALSDDEIYEEVNSDLNFKSLELGAPIWSNRQTRQQANIPPTTVQSFIKSANYSLLGKANGFSSIVDENGEQRQVGYYKSTVLINGNLSPKKKVICLTNKGNIFGETISSNDGSYRFDHLDLKRKYMFIAQYSDESNTPPDYTAVAADWQSPIPYKE